MSEIKPFRGIRFKQGNLSRLICPPYDIIGEEQRKRLLALSKHNFARVESPRKIFGFEKEDKNTAASSAKTFKSWLKSGILARENKPSFYIYTQEFELKGKKFKRTGFFAALRLEKNKILDHEKIVQKPLIGRLELMRKTGGANISPIFCLFPDKKGEIAHLVGKMSTTKNSVFSGKFEDADGVSHKISAVTDENVLSKLAGKLIKNRVLIADGHHRYHTALMFREEMSGAGKMRESYNYVLAYLCALEDPGVVIMSTHRAVRASPRIKEKLNEFFTLTQWSGKMSPYMVVYHNGCFYDMKFKDKNIRKKMSAYSKIPSSILSKTVLSGSSPEDIFYTHDIKEAVEAAHKINGYAFLIEPPSKETVYKLSMSGRIMPPKTTYFYPKIPAGLVVYGE